MNGSIINALMEDKKIPNLKKFFEVIKRLRDDDRPPVNLHFACR